MLLKKKFFILLLTFSIILIINTTIFATASCESDLSEINTSKEFKKYLKLSLYSFLQNPNSKNNVLNFSELNQTLIFYITEPTINETVICDQSSLANIIIYDGINITTVVEKMIIKPPRNVIPRCLSGPAIGTEFGECSIKNKPYFCLEGKSVQKCFGPDNNYTTTEDNCGCPIGLACNPIKGICDFPCDFNSDCTTNGLNFCDGAIIKQQETTYTCNNVCINPVINNLTITDCQSLFGLDCINEECKKTCTDNTQCASTFTKKVCNTGLQFCVECLSDNNCSKIPTTDKRCYNNNIQNKSDQLECSNPGTETSTCFSGTMHDVWEDSETCQTDQICLENPTNSLQPKCFKKPILLLEFEEGPGATIFQDSINNYDFECDTNYCPSFGSTIGINNSGAYENCKSNCGLPDADDGDYRYRNDFDYGSNFTINLLFKSTSSLSTQQFLFSHGYSTDEDHNSIMVYYQDDDKICTRIYSSDGGYTGHIHVEPLGTGTINKWFMYTLVVNQTNTNIIAQVYINGILEETEYTGSNAHINPETDFVIGKRDDYDDGSGFGGIIDEFAIWDKPLNAEEIDQLYQYYDP
jgi:hypothetical protein